MGLSFEIQYKKGVENVVANTLSRKLDQQAENNSPKGLSQTKSDTSQCLLISHLQPKWIEELLASYEGDQKVLQATTMLSSNPDPTLNLSIQQGILRYKGKAWVGKNGMLRKKLVTTIHTSSLGGHSGVWATYQRLKPIFYCPAMMEQVNVVVQE
ncbi:hypothetical protein T459_27403 [Capsicum annuum]|uniref:Integrase zinc-binding domain-containing protein n=1 Tax=Capsicum annuum TaxID=4072 RepID=A0A2G2YDU6_CAPAN|nr:hypothetical protein T459_27403 [Capsicum annuum]